MMCVCASQLGVLAVSCCCDDDSDGMIFKI